MSKVLNSWIFDQIDCVLASEPLPHDVRDRLRVKLQRAIAVHVSQIVGDTQMAWASVGQTYTAASDRARSRLDDWLLEPLD